MCGAGFQTCCIADFQVGSAALRPAGLETRDTADLEVNACQVKDTFLGFTFRMVLFGPNNPVFCEIFSFIFFRFLKNFWRHPPLRWAFKGDRRTCVAFVGRDGKK
jgi:hypothetical protein